MAKIVRTKGPGAERLKVALDGLGNKVGKVGWFETAKYEDGTPVAYVAAIHEFGYAPGRIPPRPHTRPTISREKENWKALFNSGAKAIMNGSQTTESVLDAVGQRAAGDIAKTISQIHDPILKKNTIKARLRKRADGKTVGNLNKPLVFTQLLINSVSNTVENA